MKNKLAYLRFLGLLGFAGFFVFLVSSSLLLVSTLLLAENDLYDYANMLIAGGFGVILAVCMFVFSGNLVFLELKEKTVNVDKDYENN